MIVSCKTELFLKSFFWEYTFLISFQELQHSPSVLLQVILARHSYLLVHMQLSFSCHAG